MIHLQLPANLEAYYQESGRAGRDGADADCTLLYFQDDKRLQQFFLVKHYPSANDLKMIDAIVRGLAAEGKPLGIHVTCVAPGPSRTDWAGRSMTQTPNLIDDYATTVGSRLSNTSAGSGKQAGDPIRIAEAIIALTQVDQPPRHFVLGAFGIDAVTGKLKQSLEEIEAWRPKGLATDFPT